MKITFIGSGYVGLVSGVMLSDLGHHVTCLDTDSNKIKQLKEAIPPIYELDLKHYLQKNISSNNIQFVDNYQDAFLESEAIFITVGTPAKENGEADLTYIYEAIEKAAKFAKAGTVFVIKSTVPPGTCQAIYNKLQTLKSDFDIASNPEFLREGKAIEDFINPDRIVIGTRKTKTKQLLAEIYKPLTDKGVKLVSTDLNTAELIKYAANSYLACKIAFINEMADLCESIDADIDLLAHGIGLDKRIGKDFLKVGPGFGGSCFPKDILALQYLATDKKINSLILDAIIKTNSLRPNKMVKKINTILDGIKGKTLAILGLTYKAGTDDVRCSPAITIMELLCAAGANIKAYDPQAKISQNSKFTNVEFSNSTETAITNADAVIITTEWSEFKKISWLDMQHLLKSPIIIDFRNLLNSQDLEKIGYKYYCIGKKI
ncbi:MAG: UDP-glucose/GDP-mannose dehydrogenase family protein [Rickettsiaceae bacterium]|nr:UDP-glucose/GDP-mannose dehydrogenase family protein [Rickettsiaceae bacterium]